MNTPAEMTLAVPPAPSPLQVQVARVVHRCATDIRVADADWPLVSAVIVLALPPVARAFAAADILEALRARHAEVVTSTDLGDVRMCAACHVRYPCADARMLAGEAPEPKWQTNTYVTRREAATMLPAVPELTGFLR